MHKSIPLVFAGVLVSSMAMLACSGDSGSGDEASSSGGSSSSSSSSSSSGESSSGSSSGSSSSSGGSSSSSSGSSGGSSSSSGGSELEITDFVITPPTGELNVESNYSFTVEIAGTVPAGGEYLTRIAGAPDGATPDDVEFTPTGFTESPPAGTFKFKAAVAGEYKFYFVIDGDADSTTQDDVFKSNQATITIE